MTAALTYLFIALLLSAIGTGVLWYRNRKPTSVEAGIEAFHREMNALRPTESPQHRTEVRPFPATASDDDELDDLGPDDEDHGRASTG